ncbi:DUF305 domain-containing protein [Streptomyces sp. Isolate_45]|uniref:DUF305 domain-containing protein n=1 Tax=Streptomyces sp. Isolate_45 TaxID=2950111 RepID=UPI002481E084|nr:DUF305 domain-containing protein [Streptomyces sp. Isolate_45]MDA5284081.1 DUF305 domain-containing protein [Streptomyces sp. Isolate_45]
MTAQRSLFRRTSVVVAASAAALALTACGGGDGDRAHGGHGSSPTASATPSASAGAGSTAPGGENNAADTAFALGMIPHHRQALEMARLAPTRAGSAEVKKLAEEIEKAQDPEIRTLSGWLVAWGEQVPAEGSGHGGHDMAGMMTAEEMDGLKKSSGAAFDKAFLELMVKHHEGAVAMARTEQAGGAYGPAKEMAGSIIGSQSAEIARMKSLLGAG